MNRSRSLPIGATTMLLLAGLAVLAIGYGLWSQVLTIRGRINTGNLITVFDQSFTDDDGSPDLPGFDDNDTGNCPVQAGGNTSCDPAASGADPKDRHDKDVGSCFAAISSDGLIGTVTKNQAYPGYFCTAWFRVHNSGNVPVRIARASIEGREVLPNVATAFDLNNDGQDDVAIHLTGFDACQQIDPSETTLIDIDQEILQGAPEGQTLSYAVQLQFNQWNEECTPSLPLYLVTQTGLTNAQAGSLASALGISEDVLQADGSARFTADSFLSVPTFDLGTGERNNEEEDASALEAFDFPALLDLKVVAGPEAVAMVGEALNRADLPFSAWGPVGARAGSGHSVLEAVNANGESLTAAGAPIDTHVNFALSLSGVPLIGPGAKVKVVLDPQGEVANLLYAMRAVREGPLVEILPASEAAKQCAAGVREQLGNQNAQLSITPSLQYYAPPLDQGAVQTIFPFYACEGTLTLGDEQIPLRPRLISAVAGEQPIGPSVEVSADIDDLFVSAGAKVSGGTPPYSYHWSSSTTPVLLPNAPEVDYDVMPPDGAFKSGEEVVSVQVVDVNGVSASASATLTLPDVLILDFPRGAGGLAAPMRLGGVTDVGAEWIGLCPSAQLNLAGANAAGFVNTFGGAGVNVRFFWGEQNAWERDFIDSGQRGDGLDHSYVDNVDMSFYTGHANANGWVLCSNQADTFVGFSDGVRWGNNHDLEWLVIAACGPLQLESGGQRWWQRWGPSFDGLHLLMGYQTVSADNTIEGSRMAGYALGGRTIRSSWIQAAMDTQGSSVIWAVMGVIGPSGSVNYNDHFWGRGSVGPDIRGSDVQGWWIIWGPS